MVFVQGARRSIGILSKRLNSQACMNRSYSSWAYRGTSIANVTESRKLFTLGNGNRYTSSGMFFRGYATNLSSAEQMNLIKQLRERTSAPIKDVKTSLVSCDWDIEAAQKDLRKRGVVLVMKKASRIANEGLLALATNGSKAAIIELNCETDFVARNDLFQYMALSVAKGALLVECPQSGPGVYSLELENLEALKLKLDHSKLGGDLPIGMAITDVAAMMGENIKLRRALTVCAPSKGIVSTYLHTSPAPGLGRIAGILSLELEDGNTSSDSLLHVGSELAMHIVAAKPLFLTKDLVSSDALENEHEILKSQAEKSGKSQMAIEKMVEGRLRKYYEEVVLMEQKFIVNDSINVKTVVDNLSKEVGSPVRIHSFFRMEVGEGIQGIDASNDEQVAQAA